WTPDPGFPSSFSSRPTTYRSPLNIASGMTTICALRKRRRRCDQQRRPERRTPVKPGSSLRHAVTPHCVLPAAPLPFEARAQLRPAWRTAHAHDGAEVGAPDVCNRVVIIVAVEQIEDFSSQLQPPLFSKAEFLIDPKVLGRSAKTFQPCDVGPGIAEGAPGGISNKLRIEVLVDGRSLTSGVESVVIE